MGGFAQGIAHGIDEAVTKAYTRASENDAGRFGIDMFWSMGRVFKQDPVGETVQGLVMKGLKARNDIGDQLLAPLDRFQAEAKKDPQLALMHQYHNTPLKKGAPLSQIHGSLQPGSPAHQALDPLMADPNNHTLTLPEIRRNLMSQANMHGRETALGPDSINLAATLYPLMRKGGVDQTRAEAMLAVVSQVFRDTKGPFSDIKQDIQKYITSSAKMVGPVPKGYKFPMNTEAEYSAGKYPGVEAGAHQYAMNYLAPFIAVAHIKDFAKLALLPSRVLWKTLTDFSSPELEKMKVVSGIFFHTVHSIYDTDFRYRTGMAARALKSPDVAALIQKSYHNPLFNNLRMLQLSVFGSAGAHSAEMWAKHLTIGGKVGAAAEIELKEIGLNPDEIKANGGKLSPEELETAIFHFTNNRLFMDKPLDRSRLAQKTPFFRVATMFHGYVTKEGSFLAGELMKRMRAGDTMAIAQFAGTVGILFPAAAPLIESLNTLVRTASPTQAGQKLEDDYGALTHPKGFGDFTLTYLRLLGEFAVMGAFTQYVHSAANHKLAAAVLGPVPGVVLGTFEDAATGVKGLKSGGHNYRPLERDLLHYATIPIFGNWAAEHMVPKGRQSTGGFTSSSHRGRRGRRR